MASKMTPKATGSNDFAPRKNGVTEAAKTKTYGGAKDPAPWATGPSDSTSDDLGNQGANAAVTKS